MTSMHCTHQPQQFIVFVAQEAHLSIAALASTSATPLRILLASSKCLGDNHDIVNCYKQFQIATVNVPIAAEVCSTAGLR